MVCEDARIAYWLVRGSGDCGVERDGKKAPAAGSSYWDDWICLAIYTHSPPLALVTANINAKFHK